MLILFLVATPGCAEPSQYAPAKDDGKQVDAGSDGSLRAAWGEQDAESIVNKPSGHAAESLYKFTSKKGGDASPIADKNVGIARKIITNAEIFLILEDLDAGEKQLKELITQSGGLIANSDLRGASGSQRAGHWKIRIPTANFDTFKAKVEKIGNLERSSTNSSDVTEEFYDVEARLKNKKIEETRLIQHLEKSTAKLSDILEVEKELSRVRGEIEQMQGRINMLNNLTSLTTIDVSLREVKNYVPPTAASFGDDVNRAFSSSWSGLVNTGRKFALSLVSLLPWIPFLAILGYIAYLLLRRVTKSKPVTASA